MSYLHQFTAQQVQVLGVRLTRPGVSPSASPAHSIHSPSTLLVRLKKPHPGTGRSLQSNSDISRRYLPVVLWSTEQHTHTQPPTNRKFKREVYVSTTRLRCCLSVCSCVEVGSVTARLLCLRVSVYAFGEAACGSWGDVAHLTGSHLFDTFVVFKRSACSTYGWE